MAPALDTLSSTDRGFVTWVATMLREPVEATWETLCGAGTTVSGSRIATLDLTPLGRSLRERLGPRPLQLPLAGLVASEIDVSGLDLDVLDVRLLPDLRALRCADNRLPALDLSQSRSLVELDVTGNRLMTLELGELRALRSVACAGNGLAVLVVADGGELEVLDASRNQLMVVELGDLPALREANLYRNALVRFALRSAPRLERLDLGRNDLDEIALPPLPAARWVSVARNKLGRVELAGLPAVRELKVHGNYLEALDLRPAPALVRLEARGNQIRALELPSPSRLEELDLSDNRLEALAPDAPSLVVLRAAGNELRSVSVAGCPKLALLDVSDNALESLDPAPAVDLVELRCANNPLSRLGVRANRQLVRLSTRDPGGRGPAVDGTERQRHALAELRVAHGLGSGAAEPSGMDPWELHELAAALSGRDGEARLHEVVTAPRCDLGTLLMIYWTSAPHYYLKYPRRDEVPEFERDGWDLLAAIEARVRARDFASTDVPFDPRRDRHTRSVWGVDWTVDDRVVKGPACRQIPDFMVVASGA